MRPLLLLTALIVVAPACADDSAPDPTFQYDGWVTASQPPYEVEGRTLVRAPDGGYVIVATARDPNSGALSFLSIRKYLQDGQSAPGYGGTTTTSFTAVNEAAIDSQGRLVVVGTCETTAGDDDFFIKRFSATNGLSADPSFGGGQISVAFNFGDDNADRANSVVIDADDKIVVAGNCRRADGRFKSCLVRLNEDGALDPSFGNLPLRAGLAVVEHCLDGPACGRTEQTGGLVRRPQGGYLLTGTAFRTADDSDLVVAFLRNNGTDFGSDAKLAFGFDLDATNKQDGNTQARLQRDGKLLLAGYAEIDSGARYGIAARVVVNAGVTPPTLTLDPGFGRDGAGRTRLVFLGPATNDVVARSDGRIVLVGANPGTTTATGVVWRLTENGQFDESFYFGGERTYLAPPPSGGLASALTHFRRVLEDGNRPVILGHAADSTTTDTMHVATLLRLHSDALFSDGFER